MVCLNNTQLACACNIGICKEVQDGIMVAINKSCACLNLLSYLKTIFKWRLPKKNTKQTQTKTIK